MRLFNCACKNNEVLAGDCIGACLVLRFSGSIRMPAVAPVPNQRKGDPRQHVAVRYGPMLVVRIPLLNDSFRHVNKM